MINRFNGLDSHNSPIFNSKEFENLLIKQWTQFLNPQKTIAFILTKIRDTKLEETERYCPQQKYTSLQVTVSNCHVNTDRTLVFWIDFIVPQQKGVAIGTCEIKIDPFSEKIEHIQTVGNIILRR